jgi:hypothetical protein
MNTYKVIITGTYRVSTLIQAESPAQALETIDNEWGIERVEELISEQGVDNWSCTIPVPIPEKNTGYIVQAEGELFHKFFKYKHSLLEHLDKRQRELYNNAIKYDELLNFFYTRNYFRVV